MPRTLPETIGKLRKLPEGFGNNRKLPETQIKKNSLYIIRIFKLKISFRKLFGGKMVANNKKGAMAKTITP